MSDLRGRFAQAQHDAKKPCRNTLTWLRRLSAPMTLLVEPVQSLSRNGDQAASAFCQDVLNARKA